MIADVEANVTKAYMSHEKFKEWPSWHHREIPRFLHDTKRALRTSQRGVTGSSMKSQCHQPVFSLSLSPPALSYRNQSCLGTFYLNKQVFFFFFSFSPASVTFPNYFNYYVFFYRFLSLLCRVYILPILQFLMLCPKSLSSLLMIWFSLCFRCFACVFHLTLQADLHGDYSLLNSSTPFLNFKFIRFLTFRKSL